MKIYCISTHERSKQYTEESGLLISRILIQQVSRIYCPQTHTLNITMVRDTVLFFYLTGHYCFLYISVPVVQVQARSCRPLRRPPQRRPLYRPPPGRRQRRQCQRHRRRSRTQLRLPVLPAAAPAARPICVGLVEDARPDSQLAEVWPQSPGRPRFLRLLRRHLPVALVRTAPRLLRLAHVAVRGDRTCACTRGNQYFVLLHVL